MANNGAVNPLQAYAASVNREVNGISHSDSSANGNLTQTEFKPIKPATHLQEETIQFPIMFHASLAELQKNPSASVWKPGKLASLNQVGDHVVGSDGRTYMRILTEAKVTDIMNKSCIPVGIKLSGIPVSSTLLLRAGQPKVDIMIDPEIHQLVPVNRELHVNEWDAQGIQDLVKAGWGRVTKNQITNSILEKKKDIGWKITGDSPLAAYAVQQKLVNENTLFQIKANVNSTSEHKQLYVLHHAVAQEVHDKLMNELDTLPFNNPENISATLVRLDGLKWTDPAIGIHNEKNEPIGSSMTHTGFQASRPEYIKATVEAHYQLWEIKPPAATRRQ